MLHRRMRSIGDEVLNMVVQAPASDCECMRQVLRAVGTQQLTIKKM